MIGEALYLLLTSLTDLAALIDDRVYWAAFRQGDPFPGITYNTQGIKPIACRNSHGSKQGVLEIGVLANDEVELERLVEIITDNLNDYDGVIGGYSFSIELSTDEFDERVEDLTAFYKALQFDFFATKQ